MFLYLEQILISWASHIHLSFFSLIATFVEEVIPPIPSPAITLLMGSMAKIQEYTIWGLVLLILLAAIGKTFGALLVYFVSDKAEDFLLSGRVGNFIGVTREQVASFGKRLGKGWKDYLILTFFRALPIVPSVLISVGGGLLKIQIRLFIITTFVGSIIRGAIYMYMGYVGTSLVTSFVKSTATMESIIQVIAVLFIFLVLGYLYYKRGKSSMQKIN
jgi:membrane protein DedA with SNARE-associated domain